MVALADGPDEVGVEDEEVQPLLGRNLVDHAFAPQIAQQERNIGGIRIRFGNWSHSSGKRQAYVSCQNASHCGERVCFRFRTVDGFGSVQECCVYLHAWLVNGEGKPTHEAHTFVEPTPEQIAASELLWEEGRGG